LIYKICQTECYDSAQIVLKNHVFKLKDSFKIYPTSNLKVNTSVTKMLHPILGTANKGLPSSLRDGKETNNSL